MKWSLVVVAWLGMLAAACSASAQGGRASLVYQIDLIGEFGRDFAAEPLLEALRDAMDRRADVVLVRVDSVFTSRGLEGESYDLMVDGLERGLAMARMCQEFAEGELLSEERCAPPLRLVVWIEEAEGFSSSLAWGSREVYFAPDARCEMARAHAAHAWEQRKIKERVPHHRCSYRTGIRRAVSSLVECVEGFGGEPAPCRAMHQTNYSLREDGGRLQVEERANTEPWGDPEDVGSYLTLTADRALRLGVSRGTAASKSELMKLLKLRGPWRIDSDDGTEIMRAWSDSLVDDEERMLLELRLAWITRRYRTSENSAEFDEEEGVHLRRALDIVLERDTLLDSRRLGMPVDMLRSVLVDRLGELRGLMAKYGVDEEGNLVSPYAWAQPAVSGLRAPVVYVASLDGELGTTLTPSLVRTCLESAVAARADVAVLSLDCSVAEAWELIDVVNRIGEHVRWFERGEGTGDHAGGRRVALWLHRAEGIAGLLPLLTRDVIFYRGAALGGVSCLENWSREAWQRHREVVCAQGDGVDIQRSRWETTAVRLGFPVSTVAALLYPGWSLQRRADGSVVGLHPPDGPKLNARDGDLPPVTQDEFITLDADAAREVGFSQGSAATVQEVLAALGLPVERTKVVREGSVVQAWRQQRAAMTSQYLVHVRSYIKLAESGKAGIVELDARVAHLRAMRELELACNGEVAWIPEIREDWVPGDFTTVFLNMDGPALRALRRTAERGVTPTP